MEWESTLHSSKTVQKKILELKTDLRVTSKIDYRKKLEDYFQNV